MSFTVLSTACSFAPVTPRERTVADYFDLYGKLTGVLLGEQAHV